nr:MAG TPA: hypothetical protein [Caudoviricetes sp.]
MCKTWLNYRYTLCVKKAFHYNTSIGRCSIYGVNGYG